MNNKITDSSCNRLTPRSRRSASARGFEKAFRDGAGENDSNPSSPKDPEGPEQISTIVKRSLDRMEAREELHLAVPSFREPPRLRPGPRLVARQQPGAIVSEGPDPVAWGIQPLAIDILVDPVAPTFGVLDGWVFLWGRAQRARTGSPPAQCRDLGPTDVAGWVRPAKRTRLFDGDSGPARRRDLRICRGRRLRPRLDSRRGKRLPPRR